MFEFFNDVGNYEYRCVDRNEFDWGFISTARCSDGSHPYETAVSSDEYEDSDGDDSRMIIVEAYDTKDEAKEGHAKWVDTMTNNPPEKLVDCENAGVASLAGAFGEIFETRKSNG